MNNWHHISTSFSILSLTHHFFGNACTKSGLLWFSQFSGCWLILSVCWHMSFCLSLWKIARCLVILLLPLCHKSMFAFSYVFSNDGHLGWGPMSSDTILKGDHIRTIPPRFGPEWPSSFRREDCLIHSLLNFLFLVMADILVNGRGHQTQFWKGTTKGPFHQSLVQIGSVASEELIKMWKVNGRTTDAQWWQ